MTKEEHALPPLPEATPAGYIAKTEYFYTAKQMREYALAAIMRKEPISDAEIERIIDSMPAYSGRYEVACVRAVLEKAR